MATSNTNPLQYRNSVQPYQVFDIVEKTDTYLKVKQRSVAQHSSNNYLGGLLSNDRETIYWTNETNPLP